MPAPPFDETPTHMRKSFVGSFIVRDETSQFAGRLRASVSPKLPRLCGRDYPLAKPFRTSKLAGKVLAPAGRSDTVGLRGVRGGKTLADMSSMSEKPCKTFTHMRRRLVPCRRRPLTKLLRICVKVSSEA